MLKEVVELAQQAELCSTLMALNLDYKIQTWIWILLAFSQLIRTWTKPSDLRFQSTWIWWPCTRRCILRDAGLLCAENVWHKIQARVIWATRAAVPVSPNVLSQKHCSTLAVFCCHCSQLWDFLGGISWLGEVLSKRYCFCRNREEGAGCALKCGNAAVLEIKSFVSEVEEGSTCGVSRVLRQSQAVFCELPSSHCPWHQHWLLPRARNLT